MSAPHRVELSLLGQALTVRTEASPEHVHALAAFLEERVASVRRAGIADPTKALLLAALDIADELFRERDDKRHEVGQVDARLGALVAILEQATPPTGQDPS